MTRNLALARVLALVLLLVGVWSLWATDPWTDGDGFTTTNPTLNCRENADKCRGGALNACQVLQAGDQGCTGCSFTASGYKVNAFRRLGFCASPVEGEAVQGCNTQNPVQCAELVCYRVISYQGGQGPFCHDNVSPPTTCNTLIVWLYDGCLPPAPAPVSGS